MALFGLLLGLISLEGVVRVRQWLIHGVATTTVFRTEIDPNTGLRVPVAGDDTGRIRINALGFRGPELQVPKPADRIRLAFLGGSTTFCAEVSSNERTWPDLVVAALDEHWEDLDFDYVNAAVPGFDVDASQRNFESRVESVEPDIVVIYHATNDISRDTRALARSRGLFKGSVVEQSVLSEWSVAYYLLEKNFQLWLRTKRAAQGYRRLQFDARTLSQQFAVRLRRLILAAQREAPLVAVATFSHKARRQQNADEQFRACNTSLFYMPYMTVEGILDAFEEYNRVIREIAQETGAILIDGENRIPGTDQYFADSVHFRDAGSELMSQRVVDALLASAEFLEVVSSERSSGSLVVQSPTAGGLHRRQQLGAGAAR